MPERKENHTLRETYPLAGVGSAHEDSLSSAAARLYSPNKSNRRLRHTRRRRSFAIGETTQEKL